MCLITYWPTWDMSQNNIFLNAHLRHHCNWKKKSTPPHTPLKFKKVCRLRNFIEKNYWYKSPFYFRKKLELPSNYICKWTLIQRRTKESRGLKTRLLLNNCPEVSKYFVNCPLFLLIKDYIIFKIFYFWIYLLNIYDKFPEDHQSQKL